MGLPVTIVHTQPGGRTIDLTPRENSVNFTSAAVGGFGSLEASFPGDLRKQLAYLGMTRVYLGEQMAWEGQLEDSVVTVAGDSVVTSIRTFGLQRKLTETTVRRIWSKRDLTWQQRAHPSNGSAYDVTTGQIDAADATKKGVAIRGRTGITGAAGTSYDYALLLAPSGISFVRIMGTVLLSGGTPGVSYRADILSDSGTNADLVSDFNTGAGTGSTFNVALSHGSQIWLEASSLTSHLNVNDLIQFYDMRVLATTLTEDVSGGFYGGTILRDLIALVPGLTLGMIEDGSDFTIQAIQRAIRDTAASVVSEVAGYYTREWAVWENGRFDWKTRNLDEAQWTIPADKMYELELDGTLDGVAKTVYVLYTDAATGLNAEASAVSTDSRNPYVRQGITKDILVNPGFPMTSNTSQQLATRLSGDIGARPAISGRCVVAAGALIQSAVGPAMPAAMIRGGDNVFLPDLPKTDPMHQTGRDSETIFHVVSSVVDLNQARVTLELEGQQSRADVLIGRLAAVTRTLTG